MFLNILPKGPFAGRITIPRKLAKDHKRPSDSTNSKKLGDPIKGKTNPDKNTTSNKDEQTGGNLHQPGDRQYAEKGAIRLAIPKEDQVLSNIVITPKKSGGFRPVINLKQVNEFIPYEHFKMDGLKDVKNLLQQGDLMCKLDLKDASFAIPLSPKSRKYVP